LKGLRELVLRTSDNSRGKRKGRSREQSETLVRKGIKKLGTCGKRRARNWEAFWRGLSRKQWGKRHVCGNRT